MFDLDREVVAWSRAVHSGQCSAQAAAELTDHLYCEIEKGRASGLPDQEAFAAAVAKVGARPDLKNESAKNRSWWQSACAWAARADQPLPRGGQYAVILHALVWGRLMVVASALARRAAEPDSVRGMVLALSVAAWILSERVLRHVLRARAGHGG
jgi:hypothetical protein